MTLKVRAAVLHAAAAPLEIESLDLRPPQRGELLVKMAAAGVCHSDWHVASGDTKHPLPAVLGHEGAGTVVEVGEGASGFQAGDRVTLNWAPSCGACFYCRVGRPSLCGTYVESIWAGTMLDGQTRLSLSGHPVYHYCSLACFADHVVVPSQSCVKMDAAVPPTVAALIGCAVTTGVGAVLNTARVARGSSVAVFGAGGVGLSVVMGARLAGAETIIAVDRVAVKAELARQFGATHALTAGGDCVERIASLTDGRGADYVFEAVGLPAVQEQCLAAARPGGMIVLAGLAPMGSKTNLPGALITREEKTIAGSYYGTADAARDFPRYAQYYLDGRMDLERLISRTYRLEQINEAFAEMLSGETARGVIVFE